MSRASSPTGERDRSNVTYMRLVDDVTEVITQAELASAVGASVRTVQNWTSGGTTPRGTTANRLVDLQHVVNVLREVYTDEGVQIWLRSRNRNLEGKRPIDLLAEDQIEVVLAEVHRVVGGM